MVEDPCTPGGTTVGHYVGAYDVIEFVYEDLFTSLRRSMSRRSSNTLDAVEEKAPAPAEEDATTKKVEAWPVASEGDRAAPAAQNSWFVRVMELAMVSLGCWRVRDTAA